MDTWAILETDIALSGPTDITATETAAYASYYGVPDDCFAHHLSSLGLRDAKGQPKPALTLLSNAP